MTGSDEMPECIASSSPLIGDNVFRSSALSADGTSIITYTCDLRLQTYILPPDLLSSPDSSELTPYSVAAPTPSHTFALHPYYSLSDMASTLLLQSRPDLPLRLTNALSLDCTHATYPWQRPQTEAYQAPHSIAFTGNGSHFSAGAKESIAFFDLSRSGEQPISVTSTRRGRAARTGYGPSEIELRGLVMALSYSDDGLLAAGTTGGEVGMFDGRTGAGAWRIQGGRGVSQLVWHAGKYLFAARRQSDDIGVYDVRMGREAGQLVGRKAWSTLQMGISVSEEAGRCVVRAGGADGSVRTWRDGLAGGVQEADETNKLGDDAVTNIMVHPHADVLFTTTGVWTDAALSDDDDDDCHEATTRRHCLQAWRL